MSNIAIKVENLAKQYRLGDVSTGTISHDLNRWWAKLRGKEDPFLSIGEANDRTSKGTSDYVWSLKDVNFEINQGDAVGIIGRNGAGKSTLLKLLSKVTSPTVGSIKTKGRIASLLEVGTGFHPELSGRENIFLNGAILGMTNFEIRRKFDEIVDFAGVERYIDTPVKRYSSGMYVRLAFAVAAHLESEILIVDEVLAVGDAEFQKKCLGKMGDISSGEGRTVLFVSHNLGAVKSLCNKGILLANGTLVLNSDVDSVINKYQYVNNESLSFFDLTSFKRKVFTNTLMYDFFEFVNFPISSGQDIVIRFKLKSTIKKEYSNVDIGINIFDKNENCLIHFSNRFIGYDFSHTDDDKHYLLSIQNILKPGLYSVSLFLRADGIIVDWIMDDYICFELLDENPYGYSVTSEIQGAIFPHFDFKVTN